MKGRFVTNNLAGLLALRTAAAAAVIGLTAVSPADANTEEVATWRQRVAVWVALAPGQPASYLVRGELYATDDELLPGTTVQLLIHGAIYNHDYGDRQGRWGPILLCPGGRCSRLPDLCPRPTWLGT